MDSDNALRRLLDAARAQPAPETVPLGFEHRVLQSIRSRRPTRTPCETPWLTGLWRAALASWAIPALAAILLPSDLPSPDADATTAAEPESAFESMVLESLASTEDAPPAP